MNAALVAAATLCALAGSALAQSPYGSVQFRWRERALGQTNSAALTPGATGFTGVSLDAVTNPTVSTDARFVLVLEARVTRAPSNTDLKGLYGLNFHMVSTDSRTQGQFAASTIGTATDKRNAASATTAIATTALPSGPGVMLPAGAIVLPGTDGQGDRGVFGPFRRVADLSGKNQPAVGVQNFSTSGPRAPFATLENITVAASVEPLSFVDPDTGNNGPFFDRTDFFALDAWYPVFTCVYNLADVTTPRTVRLQPVVPNATPADPGLRGFRGINNPQGLDSWIIDGTIPEFQITVTGAVNCPQFTLNPVNASACVTGSTSFTAAAADGMNPVTYAWQVQFPSGTGPWVDLTADTLNLSSGVNLAFTGRNTATLGVTVSAAPAAFTGAIASFRARGSSTCGSNTSSAAALALADRVQITSSLANADMCPSGQVALAVTATGSGTLSTQWQIQNASGTWVNVGTGVTPVTCAGGGTAYAFLISQGPLSAQLAIHGCPRRDWLVRGLVSDSGGCQPEPTNEATIRVCPSDVDCNGVSNLDDIFVFVNIWFSGC